MADGGAGYAQIGLQAVATAATATATGMKIDETISDYDKQIAQYQGEKSDAQREARLSMANQSAANVYTAGAAMQKSALDTGAAVANMGFSGVRGDSPLRALAQTEQMNRASFGETVRQGNAELAGMGGRYTTLTNNFNRALATAEERKKYLQDNKWGMIALSAAGGLVNVGSTVIDVGMRDWGWGQKTGVDAISHG